MGVAPPLREYLHHRGTVSGRTSSAVERISVPCNQGRRSGACTFLQRTRSRPASLYCPRPCQHHVLGSSVQGRVLHPVDQCPRKYNDNEVFARAWYVHMDLSAAVVVDIERSCVSCGLREFHAAMMRVVTMTRAGTHAQS